MNSDVWLRPVAEDDLATLDRMTNDPNNAAPYNWFGWRDSGENKRSWQENGLLGEERGMLLIVDGSERLGFVAWRREDTSTSSFCWNIGINLVPEARGHGYGSRAQRLLVEYLFAHTRVNRVEAGTEDTNTAEQRSLEKAGFAREGVLRGYAFRNGHWRDCVLYSVLRSDVDLD